MNNTGWTEDEDLGTDKAGDEPPPPVDNDLYEGVIVKAEPAVSGKGSKMIKLQLKAERFFGGLNVEGRSKTIFDQIVLTPESAFRINNVATAAGVEAPKRTGYEQISVFCGELTGKTVRFRTKLSTPTAEYPRISAKVERFFTEEKAAAAKAGAPAAAAEAPARKQRRAG